MWSSNLVLVFLIIDPFCDSIKSDILELSACWLMFIDFVYELNYTLRFSSVFFTCIRKLDRLQFVFELTKEVIQLHAIKYECKLCQQIIILL